MFTSDHGEMNGDAGLLYKEVFLDGAVRVPLIIRHPDHPGAHTIAEPVELLDVGATVLDFVQPESQGAFRMGRSMAGVVRGDTGAPPRTDALSEYKGEVMLATPEWKIGLNAEGETYLLFDRTADESTNLANAPEVADTQRAMENRVLQRLVASSSHDPTFAPAGIRPGGVSGVARRWLGEDAPGGGWGRSATRWSTNGWADGRRGRGEVPARQHLVELRSPQISDSINHRRVQRRASPPRCDVLAHPAGEAGPGGGPPR